MATIRICPECGENLVYQCPKFCPYCGFKIGGGQQPSVSKEVIGKDKFSLLVGDAMEEVRKRDAKKSMGGAEFVDNEVRQSEKEQYQENLAALIIGLGGAFLSR